MKDDPDKVNKDACSLYDFDDGILVHFLLWLGTLPDKAQQAPKV
jgi:hypothetical protein